MSVSDKPQPFPVATRNIERSTGCPMCSQKQPQLSRREQEMLSQREFEIMLLPSSVVTPSWWRRVDGCSKSNQILSKYFPCISVQSPYTITSILDFGLRKPRSALPPISQASLVLFSQSHTYYFYVCCNQLYSSFCFFAHLSTCLHLCVSCLPPKFQYLLSLPSASTSSQTII